MADDLLSSMRQPYRTPSERAEDRKKLAEGLGPGYMSQAPRPDDAPAPEVHIPLWIVQQQNDVSVWAVIRCPSRSGAKIYATDSLKMTGPYYSWEADEETLRRVGPAGIQDAVLETVPEFVARTALERAERDRGRRK